MITPNVKRFGILVFTSIAVSALFGGFMFFGTLVLGMFPQSGRNSTTAFCGRS